MNSCPIGARLEVEENLHEVMADHRPRGERSQGLH
jgi:CxxC motif-containing protein